MKAVLLAALLAVLPASRAAADPGPKRIALVVDSADPAERRLFETLAEAYRKRAALSRYELDDASVSNPIAKGKLLAALEDNDLVVAVGDGATEFAAREIDDVPVYFVDATVVDGRLLLSPTVSGLFSYSVDGLLDALKGLRLDVVGVAYTPGYETVADWIRSGATERGLEVVAKRIAAARELVPAVGSLLDKSRAIWILGDPLLARGAGFEFLQERALSLEMPLVGNGRWAVEQGALLGYESDPAAQAAAAERSIDLILGRKVPERLLPASRGTILYNAALAGKWRLSPPAGARWRAGR
jgi:ABC-type uncharacterized transport system substrate-binding protein